MPSLCCGSEDRAVTLGWKSTMANTNWAGNIEYFPTDFHQPSSTEEVQDLVSRATSVKVIGTRHSFNHIGSPTEVFISSRNLSRVVSIDRIEGSVWVQAGITYGELSLVLDSEGLALKNMASLPHISVGGAIATATHGSGFQNQCLSSQALALKFVLADGSLLEVDKHADPELFQACVVHLGAIGALVEVKLALVPRFEIAQSVFLNVKFESAVNQLMEILSLGYSVSLFTQWKGDCLDQIWVKRLPSEPSPDRFLNGIGASKAQQKVHPILDVDPVNCTDQLDIPGPSFDRLPHFKFDFTPSHGEELQSEYLIPQPYAQDALRALHAHQSAFDKHLLISEIRTIAADSALMSPFCAVDAMGIHFTWKKDWHSVKAILPLVESVLSQYQPKPHWGKLWAMKPKQVAQSYPGLSEFKKTIQKYDPNKKFQNPFLKELFED